MIATCRRIARRARLWGILTASALAATAGVAESRVGRVDFDPHHTVIAFHLASRLHDVHGTFGLHAGSLAVDPATGAAEGTIVVDATSGESGNASRDNRMASVVLETTSFPEIRFHAGTVDGTRQADGSFAGTLHGVLTLHGGEHALDVAIDGRIVDDELTAHGRFTVPYVAWGLTDPSVLMLTVAPTVDVDVTTTAHVHWTDDAKESHP